MSFSYEQDRDFIQSLKPAAQRANFRLMKIIDDSVASENRSEEQRKPVRTEWSPRWDSGTNIEAAIEAEGFRRDLAGVDFPRLCDTIRMFLTGKYRGIVLSGNTGAGKTFAASIIAKNCMELLPPDEIAASGTTRADIRNPFRIDSLNIPFLPREERDRLCLAEGHHAYFIDDLGSEDPANEYGVKLDVIPIFIANLVERSDAKAVITTNLTGDGIEARYGARTKSRLSDGFIHMKFLSEDKRERQTIEI